MTSSTDEGMSLRAWLGYGLAVVVGVELVWLPVWIWVLPWLSEVLNAG